MHTVSSRAITANATIQGRAWLRVCGVMFAVGWGANQFSSLLLAYKLHRGLSDGTGDALFGIYALGLIPALLVLGPISDRHGPRVITCAAGLSSGVATVLLITGDHALSLLYLGRLLAGVCSGAAFAAGTAWVKELSGPPHDLDAGPQAGARRAAIALSAGFGFGTARRRAARSMGAGPAARRLPTASRGRRARARLRGERSGDRHHRPRRTRAWDSRRVPH